MVSTVRLYIDASFSVAWMAFVGIISAFVFAGFTGDTERSLQVALAMFALTSAILLTRLWRMTRKAKQAVEPSLPHADRAPIWRHRSEEGDQFAAS